MHKMTKTRTKLDKTRTNNSTKIRTLVGSNKDIYSLSFFVETSVLAPTDSSPPFSSHNWPVSCVSTGKSAADFPSLNFFPCQL